MYQQYSKQVLRYAKLIEQYKEQFPDDLDVIEILQKKLCHFQKKIY